MNQGWFGKRIIWNVSIDMISFDTLLFSQQICSPIAVWKESTYVKYLVVSKWLQIYMTSVSANRNATRMTLPWVATHKYPPPLGNIPLLLMLYPYWYLLCIVGILLDVYVSVCLLPSLCMYLAHVCLNALMCDRCSTGNHDCAIRNDNGYHYVNSLVLYQCVYQNWTYAHFTS